jgi:hypothetical protein
LKGGEIMTAATYPPPADQLLTLGDLRGTGEWRDYRALGLGPEHIPDLIRMATDHDLNRAGPDTPEVWAPVHAWRALGQLRAEAASEPLLGLFDDQEDSDWFNEDMPEVFARIGPAAIPALAAFLDDRARQRYPRITAASCLDHIGNAHPEARDACVAALVRTLEDFAAHDPTLNAFLISSLINLRAAEAAPAIERAFAADGVDLSIAGDWEDVRIALDLLERRITPRPRYNLFPSPLFDPEGEAIVAEERAAAPPGAPATAGSATTRAKARQKSRAKMARQSRRANRRRK